MISCPNCSSLYAPALMCCPECKFSPPEIGGFRAWAPALAGQGGGFKPEYFADLAALEAGNFWFQARNRLITWSLGKHFPSLRSFMEVGCGTGYVLSGIEAAFPEAELTGSEIFCDGLGFASGRVKRATFVQMDGRHIPYRAEFDVIGAFDVLEHIREDDTVLAEMYHALKPGGGLILTVPQHPSLWSAADDYACHVRRYSAREIHDKVRQAGFEIIRSTSFVSLLLPAMLISRRRQQDSDRFNPLDEYRISPALNSLLGSLLTLERAMIQAGASLPLGGSRLIIARRTASDTV